MKLAEIKITKAVLYIPEAELMKHLPAEMVKEGLKRGKAIKRSRERARRTQGEPLQ
jgi:hypothetical protein